MIYLILNSPIVEAKDLEVSIPYAQSAPTDILGGAGFADNQVFVAASVKQLILQNVWISFCCRSGAVNTVILSLRPCIETLLEGC